MSRIDLDLDSYNSAFVLFPVVEIRLLIHWTVFFLHCFVKTGYNGEGLKLSSIFIFPGLFSINFHCESESVICTN